MSAPPPRRPRGAAGPRRGRWRRGGLDGRAEGTGPDPAPRRARRNTQAEGWSLGNSQRSARLGSARSARLGSARLGSARLGSARLIIAGSAHALDVKPFCKSFIIFLPRCRSGQMTARRRAHHGGNGLSGPTTAPSGRRPLGPLGPVDPARSNASFSFVYAFVGWVCQGAAGGVFRRFTSSFQVAVETIFGQEYFLGFFGHSLVILLVKNLLRGRINNSVRIPGSSTGRAAGRGGERGLEPGPRPAPAESELPCRSSPSVVQRRAGNRHEEPGRL